MGLLRLVLAYSVVAAHLGLWRPFDPQVAVRLFFTISGFYMGLVLDGKYPANWRGTRGFYSNRLLRLYPTYLVASGLAIGVALVVRDRPGYYHDFFARYIGIGWLGVYAAVSQILIVGQDAFLFLGNTPGRTFLTRDFNLLGEGQQAWRLGLLPPAWSLSLEIAFYALAPWLTRLRSGWLIAIVAFTYTLRFGLRHHLPVSSDPWTYRFFPFEIGTFLLGVLAYRAYRRWNLKDWEPKASLAVAAVGVFAMAVATMLPTSVFWAPLLAVAVLPLLFATTRRSVLDRSVGELSYPVYLIHYPLMGLFMAFRFPHFEAVTIAVTLFTSWALVKWMDVPIDAFRQRLATRIRGKEPSESEDPPAIVTG